MVGWGGWGDRTNTNNKKFNTFKAEEHLKISHTRRQRGEKQRSKQANKQTRVSAFISVVVVVVFVVDEFYCCLALLICLLLVLVGVRLFGSRLAFRPPPSPPPRRCAAWYASRRWSCETACRAAATRSCRPRTARPGRAAARIWASA